MQSNVPLSAKRDECHKPDPLLEKPFLQDLLLSHTVSEEASNTLSADEGKWGKYFTLKSADHSAEKFEIKEQ